MYIIKQDNTSGKSRFLVYKRTAKCILPYLLPIRYVDLLQKGLGNMTFEDFFKTIVDRILTGTQRYVLETQRYVLGGGG